MHCSASSVDAALPPCPSRMPDLSLPKHPHARRSHLIFETILRIDAVLHEEPLRRQELRVARRFVFSGQGYSTVYPHGDVEATLAFEGHRHREIIRRSVTFQRLPVVDRVAQSPILEAAAHPLSAGVVTVEPKRVAARPAQAHRRRAAHPSVMDLEKDEVVVPRRLHRHLRLEYVSDPAGHRDVCGVQLRPLVEYSAAAMVRAVVKDVGVLDMVDGAGIYAAGRLPSQKNWSTLRRLADAPLSANSCNGNRSKRRYWSLHGGLHRDRLRKDQRFLPLGAPDRKVPGAGKTEGVLLTVSIFEPRPSPAR